MVRQQQMRARRFAERGWVDWLPPHDLSAETLGRAVTEALYKPWAATPVRPPDLAGRIPPPPDSLVIPLPDSVGDDTVEPTTLDAVIKARNSAQSAAQAAAYSAGERPTSALKSLMKCA